MSITKIRAPAQHAGKVFGIGFHKTGTSSLSSALRALGYRTIHGDPRGSWPGANEGVALLSLIEAGDYRLPTFGLFDAFVDNPYFSIWAQLVVMFPEAKFILTIREEQAWIKSCAKYYAGRRVRPMRDWMFGKYADPSANNAAKQAWLDAYRRHNNAVLERYAGPNERLLILNFSDGDGWDKLCPFLGATKPARRFPHANRLAVSES
jgi:hypothetical protein